MTQTGLAVALAFALCCLVAVVALALVTLRRSAARAAAREATLRAVIDGLPDAVVVADGDGRYVSSNAAARQVLGEHFATRPDERWPEWLGAYSSDGTSLLGPSDNPLTRSIGGELVDDFRIVLRSPNRAGDVYASVTSRPIHDASGAIVAAVAVLRDVTEARREERARQHTEERFRRLSEATFEGITMSVDGIVLDSNETFAHMLGYEPEEVLGRDSVDFVVEQERPIVFAQIQSGSEQTYETVGLRKDGSEVSLEIRGRMVEVDSMRLRITAMRDITDRKRVEAKLAEQAEALRTMAIRDELTALYNRRGFIELGGQQLRLADREGRNMALVFADVNGLKQINDELGHEQGDQVIRDAGAVLEQVARSADLVARLGGDELVVLASGLMPENLAAFEARLAGAIDHHNAHAPRPYKLSMSIGVAYRAPRAKTTLEELLAEADQRMYVQKRERRVQRGAAA